MIRRSVALDKRLEREVLRHAGSMARLVYYVGPMPELCEMRAEGAKVTTLVASEAMIRAMVRGEEPMLVQDSTYWRLLDNVGVVMLQGDRS